jgi:hypothetical protein
VLRKTVDTPLLATSAQRLLSNVGWHGVAQLDYRWTGRAEDEPMLLEVNPRFFSGIYQAIESGVDYPWLLYQLAIDGDVEEVTAVDVGLRTAEPLLGFLAYLTEIMDQDSNLEQLELRWQEALERAQQGETGAAVRQIIKGLRETVDLEGRLEHIREALEEHADEVFPIITRDDPSAVFGLAFPLAVFLRHGRISRALLMSADLKESRAAATR